MKKAPTDRTRYLVRFDNTYRRQGINCLCGVDEAGRGPLAGPVVAAAVVFADDVRIKGVYDSKQVTREKREQLCEEIKDRAVSWSVGIVEHTEIDSLNIFHATVSAIKTAVSKLNTVPERILADGNFYNYLGSSFTNVIKGDEKSFSVAAASIIAKVTRDRIMIEYEKQFPNFSFSQHKGYCTKEHLQEILDYGYTEIHRRSFKPKYLEQIHIQFNED